MKKIKRCFYLSFLLFIVSCYPEKQPNEVPENVDAEGLRESTGGAPSEVTSVGTGIFFAYDQNCTAGFGFCDIKLAQPDSPDGTGTEPERPQFKRYKARFFMSTRTDSSFLRIEFNEQIPNFGPVFNVGYPDTLYNAFGYQFVVPVTGNYRPKETTNPYGAVEFPVKTGPKSSYYK